MIVCIGINNNFLVIKVLTIQLRTCNITKYSYWHIHTGRSCILAVIKREQVEKHKKTFISWSLLCYKRRCRIYFLKIKLDSSYRKTYSTIAFIISKNTCHFEGKYFNWNIFKIKHTAKMWIIIWLKTRSISKF